jgi:shikimate dehydrogenase
MNYKLGLIGYPLNHSFSPQLHAAALRAAGLVGEYCLYPVAPWALHQLTGLAASMRSGELNGLNITIPHKRAIIPMLDALTPSAFAIGAVNTVYMADGILFGHNTDAPGFLTALKEFLPQHKSNNALVLGAGGAARAVVYALLNDSWNVTLAVRQADLEQADRLMASLQLLDNASTMQLILLEKQALGMAGKGIDLIVNATPIGMTPEVDCSPWPLNLPLPDGAAVFDLVYNPSQTRLVREARAAGLPAISGLAMLVEQAALSFTCWTGLEVPREALFAAVEA